MTDLFSIEGKVAVVTGGTRGIGAMIARGFAEAGARVVVVGRRATDADAEAVGPSGRCVAVAADLGSAAGAAHLAAELERREGRLDILVNNAGTNWGAPLDEYPDAAFDKVLGVNVTAVFRLTRELLPLLRRAAGEGDPARVVNVGSIDGLTVPRPENYAYSASKAAVHMLTRHMAATLARENVTVNCIAPGYFPTKMTGAMFDRADIDAVVEREIPVGRAGCPDDIVGASIYLGSRASSYLTGVVLPVAGGLATVEQHGWEVSSS